ncbi:MAG: serine/threonine protein kinase, partial [Phycisphaerales bacterium]|nr:serine/threonine protein kinase [Phycisphaerales bacterium]
VLPPNIPTNTVATGRFTVGDTIADRYRIIQLLGQGGMGEVYHAHDTTLNQSVALKFLPALFCSNERWLARFRDEVRLARLITHTNVCRVFDIADSHGDHFISMEYIDGENLASLLRRIGHLPHDKAIQIARQLCAGLAAAHDRGVLHRDLKPANIMIDGRGHVRITDFGLAIPVDQLHKIALTKEPGTPAYMSPEQFAGKPASVRSDIYALGLIFYEMFTGHRAFKTENQHDYKRLHTSETPTSPSEFIKDIDPIVERAISKCLEKNPDDRPTSAIEVSVSLPGGNQLRAMLDAGETPSPSAIAAAGESQASLKPRTATIYLVTALLALITFTLLAPSAFLIQKAITPQQSHVPASAETAYKMLQRLGYTEIPKDRTSGFAINHTYYNHINKTLHTPDRWQALIPSHTSEFNHNPDPQVGLIYFWYRQSPDFLVPLNPAIGPQENNPPQLLPGMVRIRLDPQGTLIALQAQPTLTDTKIINPPPPPPNWYHNLFAAANLNIADLQPTPPQDPLPVYATTRVAYAGTLNNELVHIEAAECNGKPVFFSITGPAGEERFQAINTQRQIGVGIDIHVWTIMIICLIAVASVLAWRNYRSGKCDRDGAMRVAFVFAIFGLIAWAFRAHHVFNIFHQYPQFQRAFGATLYRAAVIWIFYLALEPYVRRIWPEIIISWNRLLAGKYFDTLVGRDILIGATAGTISMLLHTFDMLIPRWLGLTPPLPDLVHASHMVASLNNFSALFNGILSAIFVALGYLLIILILRFLLPKITLRNKIIASSIFILIVTIGLARLTPPDTISLAIQAIVAAIFFFLLIRHGLVALVACLYIRSLLMDFPITYDFSVWYAQAAIIPLLVILFIFFIAFYTALGGRSLSGTR